MLSPKELDLTKEAFASLVTTIAKLRDPETGCPWDLKQDHKSLSKYMIEEAYEAVEAMLSGEVQEIVGELGDVLLQVVLNAQVGRDAKRFELREVIKALDDKMIRRHPHVFSGSDRPESVDQLYVHWDAIKAQEKKAQGVKPPEGVFSDLEKGLHPASHQACAIGKRAKKIGFDWQHASQVVDQLRSEIDELSELLHSQKTNPDHVLDELGDIAFTFGQLCRHLKVDPEVAAVRGNQKFLARFQKMEALAKERGHEITQLEGVELEKLWQDAKKAGY